MSDGKITSFLNAFLAPQGEQAAKPVPIKVVSLPPGLVGKTTIEGEVVAAENGKVQIKTPQGVVTVEGNLNVEVGQKINLKLLVITERANAQNLAALIEIIDDPNRPVVKPEEIATAPIRSLTRASVELSQRISDVPITIQNLPVQARFVPLPEVLNDESLKNLVKTILQLNPLTDLPQTLSEGLEKIRQLYPLIRSDMPLPMTRMDRTLSPVLVNLIQLFQTMDKIPEVTQFMEKQPLQQGFILQMLPPGQILNGEVMKPLHEQITDLIRLIQSQQQTQSKPEIPGQTVSSPQETPVQTLLVTKQKLQDFLSLQPKEMAETLGKAAATVTGNVAEKATQLMDKLPQMIPTGKPEIVTLESFIKKSDTPLVPALALVLGQKNAPELFEGKTPTLLLLQNPRGEQSLTLMTLDVLGEKISIPKTVLPGSVLLMAVPQKIAQALMLGAPNVQAIRNETELPALNPSFGSTWPALEMLFDEILFNHAGPPESAALMRQTIPAPAAQNLTGAALFFLSILRRGEAGQWLGDALKAKGIASDKMALINQLTRDIRGIKTGLTEPLPTESWRPLPMPLQVNDQIVRLQWHFRHQDDEETDEAGRTPIGRKTRFLLDVPKTRLGDIQIDGLVQIKTLDVILRTESGMPPYMEAAIRQRYHDALGINGFNGSIGFQAGRRHYVRV